MPQATGTIQFRRGSYNAVGVGGKVLAEGEPAILVDHRIIIGQDRGGSLSTLQEALADNRAFAYHNGEAHQFGGATNRVQLEVKSHPTQTATRATVNITAEINGATSNQVSIFPDRGHSTIQDGVLQATDTAMRVRSGAPSSTTMKAFEVQRGDTTVFSVSNSGCLTISPTDEGGSGSPSLVVKGSGHASQTDAFRVEEHDGSLMMKITNSQTASATNFINCKELIIAGRDPNDPNDLSSERNDSASVPRTHTLKSGYGPTHSGAGGQGQSFQSFPYYAVRTESPGLTQYNPGQELSPSHTTGHVMILTSPTNNDNNKPFIFRKVDGPNLGAGGGAAFVLQFGTTNPSPRIFCGPVNVESDRFGPPMVHPNGASAAIAQTAAGRLVIDNKSTVVRTLVTTSPSFTPYSLSDSGALDGRVLAREEVVKAFEKIFGTLGIAQATNNLPNPVSGSKFFVWQIVFDVFNPDDVGTGKPNITGIACVARKNLSGGTPVGNSGGTGFFLRTR